MPQGRQGGARVGSLLFGAVGAPLGPFFIFCPIRLVPLGPTGDATVVFRYLKGHAPIVAVIVVLLLVQVFCDLMVPRCTSDIVDVGIQQGGIEDAVPSCMAAATLRDLVRDMDLADAELVLGAYRPSPDDASLMVLAGEWSSGDARARLGDALAAPEAAMLLEREGAAFDDAPVRGDSDGTSSTMGEPYAAHDMVERRAAAFVLSEYRAVGIDVSELQMRYLLRTGAEMLGFTALSLIAAAAVALLASRTAASVAHDLRRRVFESVLSFSRADMQGFGTASLITRCTNDIQIIQTVVAMLLRMVASAPIMGVAAGVMVALTAPGLVWIVAVAVLAIVGSVVVLVRMTLPRFQIMQTLVDRVNLIARESLTGAATVRAFGREEHEERRFGEANAELAKTSLFTGRAMSVMMPAMMLAMNAATVAIMWFGARDALAGGVQVGDIIAFINYAMQVCMAFMTITMVSVMLPRAQVAARRIDEVVETTPSVRDVGLSDDACAGEGSSGGATVCYDHVCLRFDDAEADVLHDVSFTARPGTTTAIVGSTGSGKSTLARLLPRFYDVTSGSVSINGVDVRAMMQHTLRSLVGYTPQRAVLFGGTVRSNIAYADPSMSDDRVRAAADVAEATEFIVQRPEGFDAPIAQGGSNVSGGQRQRLCIARAVAMQPAVYVFDDAFSALDVATEARVRSNLKKAAAGATVIVVAQRIATVLDADQIVVLEDGRVAGVGTHGDLMDSCPAYREMAQSQLSAGELAAVRAARGDDAR